MSTRKTLILIPGAMIHRKYSLSTKSLSVLLFRQRAHKRLRSRFYRVCFTICWCAVCGVGLLWTPNRYASAQEIYVSDKVPISPADNDWNNWIVIQGDPNDWRYLIACGDRWSPKTNTLSGFLYASLDGGRSWQLKVDDSSSGWVSEESCNFGPDETAYFIADASKLINGLTYHDLGQTRLYTSNDGGRNWASPVVWSQWTDHNTLAVDKTAGPGRGAVYVFYNAFKDVRTGHLQHIQVGSYPLSGPDDSTNGDDPKPSATTVGVFAKLPISATVLSDGSAVALFETVKSFGHTTPVEVLTMNPDGRDSLRLTQVMQVVASPRCLSYPAMAIDNSSSPSHGRIYVMGTDASSGRCRILMSSSSDNGKTWSPPAAVKIPVASTAQSDSIGSFLFTMAVNRKGVIGLAWTEREITCWHFSASIDGGISFRRSVPLSDCPAGGSLNSRFRNYYVEADPELDTIKDNPVHSSRISFSLRASPGYVWRTSMTATADGVFHPAWMESANGGGQIWTASVSVGEKPRQTPPPPPGLHDISFQVTLDFANDFYDEATGDVFVDMAVVNKTDAETRLRSPLELEITALRSDFGTVEVEGADNNNSGVGARLDLSSLIPSEGLAPGSASNRRTIWFHISHPKLPPGRLADLVVVKAKIFSSATTR